MEANGQFLKDSFGWGILLWGFGYLLGIALFMVVPPTWIGWIITPLGSLVTVYILIRKIRSTSLGYYLGLGIIWMILAIVLDYFLLVKLFHPTDGYYKLDVYLYYAFTLLLPPGVGLLKQRRSAVV